MFTPWITQQLKLYVTVGRQRNKVLTLRYQLLDLEYVLTGEYIFPLYCMYCYGQIAPFYNSYGNIVYRRWRSSLVKVNTSFGTTTGGTSRWNRHVSHGWAGLSINGWVRLILR